MSQMLKYLSRFSLFFGLSCPVMVPALAEETAFEPVLGDPLKESWCWQEFKVDHPVDVTEILASANGDLWLGTRDGVLLYKDEEFTFFGNIEGLADSGQTSQLIELSDGRTFSKTGEKLFEYKNATWEEVNLGGVNLLLNQRIFKDADDAMYIPHSGGVVLLKPDGHYENICEESSIISIARDASGTFRVVHGQQSAIFTVPELADFHKGPNAWIKEVEFEYTMDRTILFMDADGNTWFVDINFSAGPIMFSRGTRELVRHDLNAIGGSNGNTSILQTRDGVIWIASRGVLHKYVDHSWEIYRSPEYKIPASFPRLAETRQGDLLIAESGHVIQKIDYNRVNWKSYNGLHFQQEGPDGTKWFLSSKGQIICEKPDGKGFFQHLPGDQAIELPMSILATRTGEVWCVGSHEKRTAISVYKDGQWSREIFDDFAFGVSHLSVFESDEGHVYLGCGEQANWNTPNSGGVLEFRLEGSEYRRIWHTPPVVPFRVVGITGTAGSNSLWFGGHGVYRYDGNGSTLITNDYGLDGTWVDNIHASSDGRLFVTSWGKGIHQFKDGQWSLYTEDDGLPTDFVSQMLCTRNMIITVTNEGLSRLDNGRWYPFMTNQIQMNRESGTLKEDRDGRIYINLAPIDWYYRGLIREDAQAVNDAGIKTIVYTRDRLPPQTQILLEDGSRFFDEDPMVEWSGTHMWSNVNPVGMTYSWRLDGDNWSPFSQIKSILLPDLKQGWHTLEVRSRDINFNLDPAPAIVRFQVVYPFYRQAWFIPTLILIALVFAIMVTIIIRQRIQHLLEIEEVKLRFFTNISHELRTPLTLVLGPIEKAITRSRNPDNQKELSLAYRHAQRLRDLVDQLLEFRKAESGSVQAELSETALPDFYNQILQSFESMIIDKHQELFFHTNVKHAVARIDQDKLQKIIYNLISNSIKYTPDNGKIDTSLSLRKSGDETAQLEITVENNGPAIPQPDLKHIFEPYYQVPRTGTSLQKSSGIGLALTRQLVENMKGEITAESPTAQQRGSRFIISLPVTVLPKVVYFEQIIHMEVGVSAIPRLAEADQRKPDEADSSREELSGTRILIVEDNTEIREFLLGELESEFDVLSAADGETGFQLARQGVPDLIISDVMMPEMSGFEFCRNIKGDKVTNHIPVIFLTALNSNDYTVMGLQSGAIDYLIKPVSPIQLKLKIRNILESRAQLRERMKQHYLPESAGASGDEEERAFLEQASGLVIERIDDALFGVEELSSLLGMSRSALYRKFTAITDKSPAAFIKAVRLKRASELLVNSSLNITEISFQTGFSDSSTFSRAFKEHFNITPKAFREKK